MTNATNDQMFLRNLEIPVGPIDEMIVVAVRLDVSFENWIIAAAEDQAGEQVVEQPQEQRFVLVDELAQIHIPQHPHHDDKFRVGRVATLLIAGSSKYRQNVA